jgi:hypothetical protein
MAENKTRYYTIVSRETKKPVALVDCQNASQAARHFVEKNFEVRFAEQPDVFEAACEGIKPEKYTGSATPE